MRRRDVMEPEVERELAELDAALRGEPSELAAFAQAVRAERPGLDEGFAERLDAWAAAGFAVEARPGSGAGAPRRRRVRLPSLRVPRRALLPALGAAASLALVVVVAGSLQSDDEQPAPPPRPLSGPPERAAGAGSGGAMEPSETQALTQAATAADEAEVSSRSPRRVERQTSLVLAAPADEVSEVSDGVVRVTDEVGGIVASSSVSSGEESSGATFQLRVPVRRLDDALARLSRLGHVRSRTQTSLDVTGSFVSARERLDESLAERASLLRRLAAADTANETASVRERLRIVRSEIASARRSLRRLRVRTDYSTVAVSVQGDGRDGGAGGRWTPGDAMRDAVRVLEVFAGVVLVIAAVALPLGVLGGAGAVGARVLRRRRRERALSVG